MFKSVFTVLLVTICAFTKASGANDINLAEAIATQDKSKLRRCRVENTKIRFVAAPQGKSFAVHTQFGDLDKDISARFLRSNLTLFCTDSNAVDFEFTGKTTAANRSYIRHRQYYGGLPVVFATTLIEVVDTDKVVAVAADIMTDTSPLDSGKVPLGVYYDRRQAVGFAVDYMKSEYGNIEFETTDPCLMLFSPEVVSIEGNPCVVWQMEVVSAEPGRLAHEYILLDANTGEVVYHFPKIYSAMDRRIYDANNTFGDGTLILSDGGNQPPSGVEDADLAYEYVNDVYSFYRDHHQRDSWKGNGAIIESSVRSCEPIYGDCPWENAAWYNNRMYFGDGLVQDDCVAHEFTHGVTQETSKLVYADESGAINEAFSDMWGEWVDLTNGKGNDTPQVRWWMFEDYYDPPRPYRNMKDPTDSSTDYGLPMPDRYNSPYWFTGFEDHGGVHHNMGVGMKLAYLLTDGTAGEPRGAFRGYVIEGLGLEEPNYNPTSTDAADLFYYVQRHWTMEAEDYNALGDGLVQSAIDLNLSDEQRYNVAKACKAVEIFDWSGMPPFLNVSIDNGRDESNPNDLPVFGDTVTYTITVENPPLGDPNYIGTVNDINVVFYFPEKTPYEWFDPNTGIDANYNSAHHSYKWHIDQLQPGEANNFTISADVTELSVPGEKLEAFCRAESGYKYTVAIDDLEVGRWSLPVIYVDCNVSGGLGNGNSWIDAYSDLQKALDRAEPRCQIWVAKGTYKPPETAQQAWTLSLVSGVAVYGHFAGWESSISQRNLHNPNNETILSGYIDAYSSVFDVVTATDVNEATILDGFTITEAGSAAIYIDSGSPIISDCNIHHNYGAAISTNTADATINNCIIHHNDNDAIWASNNTATALRVYNNLIYHNSSGIYLIDYTDASSVTIRNNTIVQNENYGVYVFAYAVPSIMNCLVWGNADDIQGCTAISSCVQENGDNDPCFIDSGEPNEFHLGPNSPCIDAGDSNFIDANETDIDGEQRIMKGKAALRVDMGADEYYWPKADYDKDLIVDFNDYCTLAAAWRTVNPTANLIGFSAILLNDIEAFCGDWLWVAPWSAKYEQMMAGGSGSAMAMSSEDVCAAPDLSALTCSTTTTAEAEPLSAERIEELIDWTEQLLETNDELKELVGESQIRVILDSLKTDLPD